MDGEVAWNPCPLLAIKDWMWLLMSKMGWKWVELLPKWWPFSKSSTQRQGDHVSHFSCAAISMSVRHFREQTSGIGRGVQHLVVGEEQRYVAIFRKRAWWTVDDCPKVDEAQALPRLNQIWGSSSMPLRALRRFSESSSWSKASDTEAGGNKQMTPNGNKTSTGKSIYTVIPAQNI